MQQNILKFEFSKLPSLFYQANVNTLFVNHTIGSLLSKYVVGLLLLQSKHTFALPTPF